MNARQLSEGASVRVGNSPDAPRVKPLVTEPEMLADYGASDLRDEGGMVMKSVVHTPLYQRSVYTARGQSFIGIAAMLMQKLSMASDFEFGERLRSLIPLAGYRNPRRFAIDGMGWGDDNGPQRLNQYLKGRIPDVATIVDMAEKLNVSVSDLLGLQGSSLEADEETKGILLHLLALAGIPSDTADTIASGVLAAQRLMKVFPDDEPLTTRAKYAARAAWLQQQSPMPGT